MSIIAMVESVWAFFIAVIQQWILLMTGGALIALLTFFSWFGKTLINKKWAFILTYLLILIACFRVFNEQRINVCHKKEGSISEFRFMFKGSDTTPKGPRYWQTLHDGRLWFELYPDNRFSLFSVLKRASSPESANGCTGTILLKGAVTNYNNTDKAYFYTEYENNQTTQFFVPDLGCNKMHIYSRATPTTPWIDWGEMLDIR